MKNEDIKLIQLLSGDLIIAEVLNSQSVFTSIQLKNPLRVVVMPGQNTRTPSIAFAPWCEFSDDVIFDFDKSHILTIMSPIPQFLQQYQQTFGKIITPTQQLIIPGA